MLLDCGDGKFQVIIWLKLCILYIWRWNFFILFSYTYNRRLLLYRVRNNYGNTHFIIFLGKKKKTVKFENFLNMLMDTIILNKYQQHFLDFSSLVFNNSLQSTLESFACGTLLFLGNQVLFSSQVRLLILVLIVVYLKVPISYKYCYKWGIFDINVEK